MAKFEPFPCITERVMLCWPQALAETRHQSLRCWNRNFSHISDATTVSKIDSSYVIPILEKYFLNSVTATVTRLFKLRPFSASFILYFRLVILQNEKQEDWACGFVVEWELTEPKFFIPTVLSTSAARGFKIKFEKVILHNLVLIKQVFWSMMSLWLILRVNGEALHVV